MCSKTCNINDSEKYTLLNIKLMCLLWSIIISSTMPLYGSSMTCVQSHLSPQSIDLYVLLHIILDGISCDCVSNGEDGRTNEISSIREVEWRKSAATIIEYNQNMNI